LRVGVIYGATRWGVKGSHRTGLPVCESGALPSNRRTCRPATGTVHVKGITGQRIREMLELLGFLSYVLTLYIYVLFAAVIMSWLIAFNVVNPRNRFVAMVAEFLFRITDPVLRPIRNLLPNLGGIDISPIIVILVIVFIQSVIIPNLARALI
jgi:YggT family protein